MDDRQLGEHLAAALARGKATDTQEMMAVLRRLLPPEDPRLDPLVALVRGRQFQDLAGGMLSAGEKRERRETLRRSLAATQPKPLVSRLEAVLEGCFPTDASAGPPPICETEWRQKMCAIEEETKRQDTPRDPPLPPPRRWTWLQLGGGLAAGVGLLVLALEMVWGHRICGTFGICSVVSIQATVTALEQAQGAASRLAAAQTLADYDQSLREVELQLRRVENEAVLSESQRLRLQLLEEKARAGRIRLKKEEEDQQTVQRVAAGRMRLERLPVSQAMQRRNELRSQLEGIAASSFSHPQALVLRQTLQPPLPSPPSSPSLAPPSLATPPSEARSQASRFGGSRPRYASPPAVRGNRERDSSDAPLRPEPLW